MDSTSTPVAMHGSWQLAATRRVALVVASASGPGLFESLVAEVASALPAAAVMVSVFADDSQATLRVLAMHENGQPQPGFDYPVVGSPCAQVVGRDYRYYANGVRAQVDPRSLFAQAGFDAYAAFPLNDSQGRPLGVLAALDRVPIAHGDAEHAEVVLKVVAGRLAAELERQQALQDLRQTAVAVSSARAESVFADLAAALAQILRVDCAYIAHQRADDPGHLATLALQRDGVALPGLRYALATSACSEVLGRQFHVVERDLARRFPDDPDLLVKGPESYAGHPLVAQDGAPLGVIAVGSRQPLVHAERIEAVLRIFAVRAAAEVERLAATEALRRSEASYRGIFEAAPDSIYVHDWETFAFRDFNRTAAETLGYTRADLLAVEPHQLMAGEPPYDVAHAFEFLRQAKLGRCPPFEWRTRRKDGSLQWQEVHLKPVVIDGAPQILAFTRDISERKAAEERLRASEEQYRAIFDASDDALILWNSRYERVDVNPAYERLFGWTRDEVVGRSFEVFSTDPVYAQPRRELVTRALAGETCRAELQYQRKDGRRIDTEVHTIPFRHRGEPHVLAIARDITERTRLEEQLRQAQKMEAIGQLTGGIAHDFNNILTSVLGYIVLARERARPRAAARLPHQRAPAHRAGERARDLVAQMLAFARRKSGRRQALAPQALLLETVELLRATLPSSVLLDVCAAGAALPAVEVDPVQMGQVLMNLLINARDAVAGAGRVQVGLHAAGGGWRCAACAAAVPDGSWVEVRVADDGCGIEPDTLRRIFDPFFTTKPSGHGSGMGLAMVHGIVHDHGGHVVVDTRVGAGATFRVLLPAAATQTTVGTDAPPRPAPSTATALAGHVLVVEDDEQVGAYLAELLGAWGLEVTLHADAREALRWLEDDANRAQLVITDLTMPHLSGLQLARKALLHRPGLPVLLVSADLSAADARALADSGVRAALPKPVDAAALRRAVLSALAA